MVDVAGVKAQHSCDPITRLLRVTLLTIVAMNSVSILKAAVDAVNARPLTMNSATLVHYAE
jgi:hypothetical protein